MFLKITCKKFQFRDKLLPRLFCCLFFVDIVDLTFKKNKGACSLVLFIPTCFSLLQPIFSVHKKPQGIADHFIHLHQNIFMLV